MGQAAFSRNLNLSGLSRSTPPPDNPNSPQSSTFPRDAEPLFSQRTAIIRRDVEKVDPLIDRRVHGPYALRRIRLSKFIP